MKKYLFIIASLLLAATACTTFKDEASIKEVIPSNPLVQISDVVDDGFTFTVTPAAGTGFYSYAVIPGKAEELNPTTLLKVGYKTSVKAGTVDFTKETAPFSFKMEGLPYNTTYTVYAVAASELGNVGNVVSSTVTTSDNSKPAIVSYTRKGNVLTVTFSENVTTPSEKRKASANYYAINAVKIGAGGTISQDGKQGEGDVAIACNGKTATLTVTLDGTNPLPDGAYYTVSFGTGLFQDESGNSIESVSSEIGVTSAGAIGFSGLYGRVAAGTFAIEGDAEREVVVDGEEKVEYGIPEGVTFAKFAANAAAGITVKNTTSSKTTSVTYNLTPGEGFTVSKGVISLELPADFTAKAGDEVTFAISEGALVDIYGNTSDPFSASYLFTKEGLEITDIIGAYSVVAFSYFDDAEVEDSFILVESNDASKGNVMFSNLFGDDLDEGLFVYAYFDTEAGTLTVADWQPMWYSSKYVGYWMFTVNGADEVTFKVPAPGKINDPDNWFGYYIYGESESARGWGCVYETFNATRVAEAAPAKQPAFERKSFGKQLN